MTALIATVRSRALCSPLSPPRLQLFNWIEANIKLPDGVSCTDCTLAVRQLMTGKACPANADAVPETTYYSCADIRISSEGSTPPPTTKGGDDDDSSEDGSEESSSARSRRLSSSDDSSGCAVGPI